eukprot:s7165_g3.t1
MDQAMQLDLYDPNTGFGYRKWSNKENTMKPLEDREALSAKQVVEVAQELATLSVQPQLLNRFRATRQLQEQMEGSTGTWLLEVGWRGEQTARFWELLQLLSHNSALLTIGLWQSYDSDRALCDEGGVHLLYPPDDLEELIAGKHAWTNFAAHELADMNLTWLVASHDEVVLHYPATHFERLWRKYHHLGNFPSVRFGGDLVVPPSFHLEALTCSFVPLLCFPQKLLDCFE